MLGTKTLSNGKEIIIGNNIKEIEQMIAAEKYIQESKLKQHNETFGVEMNEKNLAWEEKVEHLMKTYINEDINMMIRHLKKIHAELVKGYEKYGDAAVEVRALGRKSKTEKAIAYRSYVFYNFTDKSIDGFKDWYNKVVKGKAVCLYYSVANFEPKIRAYDSDGNRIKKNSNMINGDNVVIDVQVAQRMLEQLKSNEMKMYLLFKSLIVNKEIDKFNIQAIATMLGVSVRTVKTVRKSLADKGFIIIQKQGTTICDKYLVF